LGVADDIFNFFEGFLHEGLECGAGLDVLAAQRIAGIDA